MVTQETATRLALEVIRDLNNKGIHIIQSYLFGSVVGNKNTEFSDIDIAIISDSFSGFLYEDRKKINHSIARINSCIEPHPFTSVSFTIDNPFVREIIKTGVRLV